MNEDLKKCTNPLCKRQVRTSVAFCCHPCDVANTKGYEIHDSGILGHTNECNSRHATRGEWKDGSLGFLDGGGDFWPDHGGVPRGPKSLAQGVWPPDALPSQRRPEGE